MGPLEWLLLALTCTALAQVSFKAYFARKHRAWLAMAVALFLMVPVATYHALKGFPLGTVYIATAASQLLVVAISLAFLRERYSPRQYTGFALVLAGIVLYNL